MRSEFDAARERMLHKQLRRRGIHDPRVLAAMGRAPRERFVPPSLRGEAYADRALGIDCGQTISQPYIVALMTEALQLDGTQKVLEVGTGSGYQAAVLAELAARVMTIERHAGLSAQAAAVLAELGYGNVEAVVGDGSLGYPARAPFDRILVAAAAETLPPPLWEQLAEGGIVVIPLGSQEYQQLYAIRKWHGRAQERGLSACRFVPLIGDQAWSERGPQPPA